MLRGVDIYLVAMSQHLASQRTDLHNTLNLVPPELDSEGRLLIGRLNLQSVPSNTKSASGEIMIVSFVLHLYQTADKPVSLTVFALLNSKGKAAIFLRFAQAIDAGNRGNNDHISTCEESPGSGVPQFLNFLIYVGLFLNIEVGAGDVSLRLIIVVVTYEILHGIVGKELLELRY